MKRILFVSSLILALGVVSNIASADHSQNWGDNYLEQLLKNGSSGG